MLLSPVFAAVVFSVPVVVRGLVFGFRRLQQLPGRRQQILLLFNLHRDMERGGGVVAGWKQMSGVKGQREW